MDIASLAATASVAQAAQRDQQLSIATLKQRHDAEQSLVDMLAASAPPAPSGDPNRGQQLDIRV